MSTRGVIAKTAGDGWVGVYNHFDSYPSGLGEALWHATRPFVATDDPPPAVGLQHFIEQYIDAHSGGWSSFPDRCYCHDMDRSNEPDMIITSETVDALFYEYVYIIDPSHCDMIVLGTMSSDDIRRYGFVPMSLESHGYMLVTLGEIDLLADSVDWSVLFDEYAEEVN